MRGVRLKITLLCKSLRSTRICMRRLPSARILVGMLPIMTERTSICRRVMTVNYSLLKVGTYSETDDIVFVGGSAVSSGLHSATGVQKFSLPIYVVSTICLGLKSQQDQ